MCYGIEEEKRKGELPHSRAHRVNFDFFNTYSNSDYIEGKLNEI